MRDKKVFCSECRFLAYHKYERKYVCMHPKMIRTKDTPIRKNQIDQTGDPYFINKHNDCQYFAVSRLPTDFI